MIALALEEMKQIELFNPDKRIIVISEESKKSPQKIPAVCKHFGVEHLSLLEFFKSQGWSFKLGNQ